MAVAPDKQSHHCKPILPVLLVEKPPWLRVIPAVRKVGEIAIDLTSVDFDMFESTDLDTPYAWQRVKLYKVVFDLVTVVEDDLGYMHFRAVCHGKKVGEVRLEFSKDD